MISIERSSIDMVYYLFCFNNDKGIGDCCLYDSCFKI